MKLFPDFVYNSNWGYCQSAESKTGNIVDGRKCCVRLKLGLAGLCVGVRGGNIDMRNVELQNFIE